MLSETDKQSWLNVQIALALTTKNKELSEFVALAEEQKTYIDKINYNIKRYFDVFCALFSVGATIKEICDVLDQLKNRDEYFYGDWGTPNHRMNPTVVDIAPRLLEALSKLSIVQ